MLPPFLQSTKLASNVGFLLAAAVSAAGQLWVQFGLAVTVFIASTAYHASHEQRFVVADRLAAIGLVCCNAAVVVTAKFPPGHTLVALVAAAYGLYMLYWVRRDDWEWHLAGSFVTIACGLTAFT
jgi:hypothetical protein